jgi:hypothetical protein
MATVFDCELGNAQVESNMKMGMSCSCKVLQLEGAAIGGCYWICLYVLVVVQLVFLVGSGQQFLVVWIAAIVSM